MIISTDRKKPNPSFYNFAPEVRYYFLLAVRLLLPHPLNFFISNILGNEKNPKTFNGPRFNIEIQSPKEGNYTSAWWSYIFFPWSEISRCIGKTKLKTFKNYLTGKIYQLLLSPSHYVPYAVVQNDPLHLCKARKNPDLHLNCCLFFNILSFSLWKILYPLLISVIESGAWPLPDSEWKF